ncbi:MAG: TolC family protein [Myxococcota bacterium]
MIALLIGLAWGAPLQLGDVLDRVDARLPAMAAAEARVDEAHGKVLSTRGAFDPVLVGKGGTYLNKYPRTTITAGVATDSIWGPSLEVGWARGVGDFPAYAEDAETGPSGEVYAHLAVPVLDGLGYGKDRAYLESAQASRLGKEAALLDVRRKARLEAAKRYWSWVAAHQALQVAEDQRELARQRNAALQRQVELGSRPQLDLIDNQRVLYEREAAVAMAEQKVQLAGFALSLFLRDPGGAPEVPTPEQAPAEWPALDPLPEADRDLQALGWRPDRAKADAEVLGATIDQRRAKNALLPKLEVSATGIQPLDPDTKTEIIGGVSVEAPLAFRQGIGERRAADARSRAVQEERRALDDAIRAEVAGALEARRLAEAAAVAAREAAERAREVLQMERRRVELGGSDLFQLLLREDSLAKARKASIDAEYDLRVADAVVRAALHM